MVKVVVKGVNSDNTYYLSIVEGLTVQTIENELRECMGIVAHTQEEYNQELIDIGFNVITDIKDVNIIASLDVVTIPINLIDDENIF